MPRVTRPAQPGGVTAILPLRQSNAGGSGSFLVRADDDARYWCKTLNNPQNPRVPINEEIAARVGVLARIAVCEPMLVYMPEDLAGWEFRQGHSVEVGWAHGSSPVVRSRIHAGFTRLPPRLRALVPQTSRWER
jgi:hypothetical protein